MNAKEVFIKLELNLETTNRIIAALAEMPYKLVADDIAGIREQAQKQVDAYQKKLEKQTKDAYTS